MSFLVLPGRVGSGRVTNISLSGAFMETSAKFRLLTVVYLEGLIAGTEPGEPGVPKRIAATVVRRSSIGVGLEWCEPWALPASQLRILAGGTRSSPAQETAPDPAAALAEPPLR